MDPEGSGKYYRSITGKMSLSTVDVTGASYASTSGDPASMVVPGNASPVADGTPLFDSADGRRGRHDPERHRRARPTRCASRRGRPRSRSTGTAIYRVHVDGGATGWMTGGGLVPRDCAAPRVWEVDDGAGVFSPNGDGAQDELPDRRAASASPPTGR